MNIKTKEFNMNKLKKLGLTALGTSLVASSAIAADASLTGNVGYTWSSEEVGTSTTDGIGYEADFNMVVSGEMDNGWTATGSLLLTESATLSSSWTSLTMGSMGTIIVGNGYGGVGQAFDDVTPRAYEENHDGMKTSTAIDNVGANMGNGSVMYFGPTIDVAGFGVQIMAGYAPEASNVAVTDGAVSTSSNLWSSGQELGVKISGMGITAGAYANELTKDSSDLVTEEDAMTATWHVSYNAGPVSIGYQEFYNDNGFASAGTETPDTEGDGFGIAISQDNYSISYSEVNEQTKATSDTAALEEVEMSAIQGTYTMGAMTLGVSMYETDNPEGATGKYEETELSVSFAF